MNKLFLLFLFFASLALLQSQASANTAEFSSAATKITNLLLSQGETTVAFDALEHSENAIGNYGPGLRAELILAFETVNMSLKANNEKYLTIGPNATFKVRGSYSIGDDPDDLGTVERKRLLALEVTIEITNGVETQSDFTFFLSRERDIIAAEGLNIQFDDQQRRETRSAHTEIRRVRKVALQKHAEENRSSFFVEGSKIKTNPNSEYAIELLTKSPAGQKYTPRKPKADSGVFPFVPVGVGEVYGIKVYNNSDQEIGVAMKIDGIDQFTFSEERDPKTGRPRFTTWIIAPNSSFTIKGWHITADNTREDNLSAFQVTGYGEGASRFVRNVAPSGNGVITVAISNSFDQRGAKTAGTETGFGPPVKQNQKVVNRQLEPPHEFLALRYNR